MQWDNFLRITIHQKVLQFNKNCKSLGKLSNKEILWSKYQFTEVQWDQSSCFQNNLCQPKLIRHSNLCWISTLLELKFRKALWNGGMLSILKGISLDIKKRNSLWKYWIEFKWEKSLKSLYIGNIWRWLMTRIQLNANKSIN